jgi:hypothetical protein
MLEENVDEKVMYIVYMSIDKAIGRAPYKVYIGCLVYGNRVPYMYVYIIKPNDIPIPN